LQVPADLDEAKLVLLLQMLIDTHACLRLRVQLNRDLQIGPKGLVRAEECVRIVPSAPTQEVVSSAASQAQETLDPEAGKMLQAVWFMQQRRLLLVVHHLAVDGVSWRILLSDLAAGWSLLSAGKAPVLEPVATSFRRWTQYLSVRAHQPSV